MPKSYLPKRRSFQATAIWLRNLPEDKDRLQVLVEIDGVWRLAIDDYNGGGLIGHTAEGNGVDDWPIDRRFQEEKRK